uniref:Uncharacterized protein n=1 Tax=Glossina palpalis gambiensis TaxID=67801 RepID=A0A1B0AU03_9MUSC
MDKRKISLLYGTVQGTLAVAVDFPDRPMDSPVNYNNNKLWFCINFEIISTAIVFMGCAGCSSSTISKLILNLIKIVDVCTSLRSVRNKMHNKLHLPYRLQQKHLSAIAYMLTFDFTGLGDFTGSSGTTDFKTFLVFSSSQSAKSNCRSCNSVAMPFSPISNALRNVPSHINGPPESPLHAPFILLLGSQPHILPPLTVGNSFLHDPPISYCTEKLTYRRCTTSFSAMLLCVVSTFCKRLGVPATTSISSDFIGPLPLICIENNIKRLIIGKHLLLSSYVFKMYSFKKFRLSCFGKAPRQKMKDPVNSVDLFSGIRKYFLKYIIIINTQGRTDGLYRVYSSQVVNYSNHTTPMGCIEKGIPYACDIFEKYYIFPTSFQKFTFNPIYIKNISLYVYVVSKQAQPSHKHSEKKYKLEKYPEIPSINEFKMI